MLKGTTFSGQPVFAQITGMINRSTFATLVKEQNAERYCKHCKYWEHLMCMLYSIKNNCTSLREVTHGIAAYGDKLNHLGITYTPPRSTLSDANLSSGEALFGAVYQKLYGRYKELLSDSHPDKEFLKRVLLIDSTTTSLFKAIMKCVGRKPADGKSKGGIKVHTMLNAYEQVPQLIHFTDAATHHHTFISELKLQPHQIAVFDRAYVDYLLFTIINKGIEEKISFSNLVNFARQHLFSYKDEAHRTNRKVRKAMAQEISAKTNYTSIYL